MGKTVANDLDVSQATVSSSATLPASKITISANQLQEPIRHEEEHAKILGP